MVEMKNPIKEADANPKVNHLSLWRTDFAYFWVINCERKLQDDMHYHENDDHIFMVLEGECTIRTPHKEPSYGSTTPSCSKPARPTSYAIPVRAGCCFSAPATRASTASPNPGAKGP